MIKLLNLILEKRSHPELNVKKSVLDKLEPYANDPNYFVSFTNIEKIGINPVNKFSTPIGVYSYNLKDLWNDWIAGDDFFGKDRPYVNLIKLNSDRVLNVGKYKMNKKDIEFLKNKYEQYNKSDVSFDEFIKNFEQLLVLKNKKTFIS